jgi:hypothetical protein
MTKILPQNFGPELVEIMRSVLDEAVERIHHQNRTSATKAKMAERIVRTASGGAITAEELLQAALDEGKEPAA